LFFALSTQILYAQPWIYNLGTTTGNHTSSASTSFLPAPSSGTTYVRIGAGGGSINLENPGLSNLGSDTEIRAAAPTSSSINKFSVVNYTASKLFSVDFSILLGSSTGANTATTGTWYFFIGDGSTYSDANAFSNGQVFTGLRFSFGTSGSLTVAYRNGTTWSALGSLTMVQSTVYRIKIYGNNSTSTQTYDGGNQSVASNKFDIYVDGIKVGDDLSKAGILSDANLDSFMFYGEASTSNVANIFVDDIIYSNALDVALDVELSRFNAKSNVNNQSILSWQTASEKENAYFGIEHSTTNNDFREIAQVKGNGNSTQSIDYQYLHTTPSVGVNYYRLRQVDNNGTIAYSPVRSVWVGGNAKTSLFPTVSHHEITLRTNELELTQTYQIFNLLGELVLVGELQGQKTIEISALPKGLYLLKVNQEVLKFVKE
jgi:hypothetical protein